jgi:hypothetical protein
MTGRGAGYCTGSVGPGFMNRHGVGGGRGCRNQYYVTGLTGWQRAGTGRQLFPGEFQGTPVMTGLSKEEQTEALRSQAGVLEERLGAVKKRLEELTGEPQR